MLTVDASTIGAASISNGENALTYQDIVGILPALSPNMKRALLILFAAALVVQGCGGDDKPTLPDGVGTISVVIIDTTGTIPGSTPGEPTVVEGANVSLQARTHEYVDVTDADAGVADFSLLPAGELCREVTGAALSIEPYLDYLTTKFGEIYGFDPSA